MLANDLRLAVFAKRPLLINTFREPSGGSNQVPCSHAAFVASAINGPLFDTFHSPLLTCAQLSVASSDKLGSQFGYTLALEARCRQRSLVRFEGAVVARE